METGKQQKNLLRQKLRQQAKQLSAGYIAASNAGIEQRLRALPQWQNAKTVFLFISMGTEPYTHGLLRQAVSAGKRVGVPRCLDNGVMETRQITSLKGLVPKSFGILEPDETAPLLLPGDFDLVVAPCVAADENGYRLGNGGGYYDRYLPQTGCPVVCLCRDRLLQKKLPVEEFDVPMDMVLTEDRLIVRG